MIVEVIIYLLLLTSFRFTISQQNTTSKPIAISITVPHAAENVTLCAGINDAKTYKDFPQQFQDYVCWNVNLTDWPDIGETFEHTFAPRGTAGTYYAGAVLYTKTGHPVVLPLQEFEVE